MVSFEIKRMLNEAGFTQTYLARKLNIKRQVVNKGIFPPCFSPFCGRFCP